MPTNTPNLNLIKPLVSEHYDVVVANANNDILDTEVANKAPLTNPTFTGTQTLPNIVTNGIKFPATQVPSADPNTLDDYEEGTFNPTDISGAGLTFTYLEQGTYIKLGSLVILKFDITFPANSSTAFAYISVPFPALTCGSGIIGYRDFAEVVMMYGQNFYRDVGAYTNQLLQGRRLAGTLIYTATT